MTDLKREMTQALVATLGAPASEIGGLVADKIRYLRWRSAIHTLERAREISRKKNLSLTTPTLKFLVPFLENCSLEEDTSYVQEYWANLLVAAGSSFQPGHLLFMRLLRELTGSEVRLLERIATNDGRYIPSEAALDEAQVNWEMFGAPASPLREKKSIRNWDEVREFIFERFQTVGVGIDSIGLWRYKAKTREIVAGRDTDIEETLFVHDDRIHLDILKSLNIIDLSEQQYVRSDESGSTDISLELVGTAWYFTPMGAAFFSSCSQLVEKIPEE